MRPPPARCFALMRGFGTLVPMAQRAQTKAAVAAVRRVGRPVTGSDRDADATRANILCVAMEEFSSKGSSGSRVDEIAERTPRHELTEGRDSAA
jgi:hypothetical protein